MYHAHVCLLRRQQARLRQRTRERGRLTPEKPHPHRRKLVLSVALSSTAQLGHTGGAASITQDEMKGHSKGVILVSEAFIEINAGLVILLASGRESDRLSR